MGNGNGGDSESGIEGGGKTNPKTGDTQIELGIKGKRGGGCFIEIEIPPDFKDIYVGPKIKLPGRR